MILLDYFGSSFLFFLSINLADNNALPIFFLFLFLFAFILWFTLRKKISGNRRLKKYLEELNNISDDIENESGKGEFIKEYLDVLQENNLIRIITSEWLLLQRSLSNFQKYDFELHIDYFVRNYRIDSGKYARNLLLTGLLFTFIGLAWAFISFDYKNPNNNLIEELNQIIPKITLAFTSTIAALVASLTVLFLSSMTNQTVDDFQAKMSHFLIVNVHPYFEKAGQEAYLNRVASLIDGVGKTIRDVNSNLDIVANQSRLTLTDLAKGVKEFTEVTNSYGKTLKKTEILLEKVHENGIRSEEVIKNVNEVVHGMSNVFSSEDLVLKDLAQAARKQQETIEQITIKTENLVKASDSRLNELQKIQIESDEQLKTAISEQIASHIGNIGDSVTALSSSLDSLPDTIQNQVKQTVSDMAKNSLELNEAIKSLTGRFEKSFEEANQRFGKTSSNMEQFSEQVSENMKTLTTQIAENQRLANISLEALISDYKKMIQAISTTNEKEAKEVWEQLKILVEKQSNFVEELNSNIVEKIERLGISSTMSGRNSMDGATITSGSHKGNNTNMNQPNGPTVSEKKRWWQFGKS